MVHGEKLRLGIMLQGKSLLKEQAEATDENEVQLQQKKLTQENLVPWYNQQ